MERVNMTKITEPARKTFGHLQKMVRDIKKNEGGFMDKIKKITNKTPPNLPRRDYPEGENGGDDDQWSDDFDSDYENPDGQSDSETYVVPGEGDFDDSYEPPPAEADKRKVLPPFSYSRGVYEDNQGATSKQQQASSKLLPGLPTNHMTKQSPALSRPPPQSSLKSSPASLKMNPPLPTPRIIPNSRHSLEDRRPHAPPKEHGSNVDEDDYILPVEEEDEDEDEDDDNYIEPTEEAPPRPSKPPPVNRDSKPTSAASTPASMAIPTTVLYEVCEQGPKPSPPQSRASKPMPPKFSRGGAGGGPPTGHDTTDKSSNADALRNNAWRSPAQQRLESAELPTEDEYEICDPDDPDSNGNHIFKPVASPAPLPRISGPKMPTMPNMGKMKMVPPPRDSVPAKEDKPTPKERWKGSNSLPMQIQTPPLNPKPPLPKPTPLPKPPEPAVCNFNTPARNNASASGSSAEQDAGVYSKDWYASACDRRAAEEALQKSNKDGAFLIRKSTTQDPQQPYTLVVLFNRRVYNIPVRYIEATQQYALGKEKTGEERFNSVADMVLNHQRTALVLIDSQNNTKDSTRLKHPVRVS